MARSEADKEMLRENAMELISGEVGVRLASHETTGENDFKYEKSPSVCAVVVDKGSVLGFAQITGGGKKTERINTGRGDTGYVLANISSGQTCMLYGEPTVLYFSPWTES